MYKCILYRSCIKCTFIPRDLTDVTLGEEVDEAEYDKFKTKIMSLIDDNNNGKLEAKELVSLT